MCTNDTNAKADSETNSNTTLDWLNRWTLRRRPTAAAAVVIVVVRSLAQTKTLYALRLVVQCWWKPAHDDTTAAAVRRVPIYTGHRASRPPFHLNGAFWVLGGVHTERTTDLPTDLPPPFTVRNVRKRYNDTRRRCCCFSVGGELFNFFFSFSPVFICALTSYYNLRRGNTLHWRRW